MILSSMAVSPGFYILCAAALLSVPLPWLAAALIGAVIHELCHLAAIRCLGGKAGPFLVQTQGAVMGAEGLSYGREALAAAAGPGGSLMLGLLIHKAPRLALCGLIQGCFNLLPVYPLDGGRILHCLFCLIVREDRAFRLSRSIGIVTSLVLLMFSLYLTFFMDAGLFPAAACTGILLKLKKYLAKTGDRHYNRIDYES